MADGKIDQLIINSPFEEPEYYWDYNPETRRFTKKEGRRRAGYLVASDTSRSFDDPGHFIEIPLVNTIRPRVKAWREAAYPGSTGITKYIIISPPGIISTHPRITSEQIILIIMVIHDPS